MRCQRDVVHGFFVGSFIRRADGDAGAPERAPLDRIRSRGLRSETLPHQQIYSFPHPAVETGRDHLHVLGVDPQIWFQDGQGNRAWVIVRYYPQIKGSEWEEHVGLEKLNSRLRPYDVFFSAVSLASSEPLLLDLEGKLIPLSERFTGNAPLYRGDAFHIKYGGLKRIYIN